MNWELIFVFCVVAAIAYLKSEVEKLHEKMRKLNEDIGNVKFSRETEINRRLSKIETHITRKEAELDRKLSEIGTHITRLYEFNQNAEKAKEVTPRK